MTKSRAVLSALALLTAVPAAAAPRYSRVSPYEFSVPDNALRLEIGGATLSSNGLYCPAGGPCFQDSAFQWDSLAIGGDLDIGLGRSPLAFTMGVHELAARDAFAPNILEPTIGVTARFLRHQVVQPRIGIGAGLMVGNDGNTGGSFRIGGGLSLFANAPVGLAVDLMVDLGYFADYRVTQVQLAIGPEFHF